MNTAENTANAFTELNAGINEAIINSGLMASASKRMEEAFHRQFVSEKNLEAAIEAVNKGTAGAIALQNKAQQAYTNASKALDIEIQYSNKLAEEKNRLTKMTKALSASYKNHESVAAKTLRTTNHWLLMLGTTGLTLNTLKNTLLKYNQSVYDLSRLQQTGGKGIGDFSQALNIVKKETVLSTSAFMEFANEVARGTKGLAPTTVETAKLAGVFQQQFGPGLAIATEKWKLLQAVQNKAPSMAKALLIIQKKVNDGIMSEAEANKKAASMAMAAKSMGMDKGERQFILQMASKTTKKQKEQVELNRTLAESNQHVENAILNSAKAMENAATTMVTAINKVLSTMEQIPIQIMSIVAAMSLLNKGPMFKMLFAGSSAMSKGASTAVKTLASSGSKAVGAGIGSKVLGAGVMTSAGLSITASPGRLEIKKGTKAAIKEASKELGAAAGSSRMAAGLKFGGITGLLTGGYSGYVKYKEAKEANDPHAVTKGIKKGASSAIGTTVGAIAGSLIAPGVGTAIGGMVGGFFGEIIGEKLVGPIQKAAPAAGALTDETAAMNSELMKAVEAFDAIEADYKNIYEISMANVDAIQQQYGMLKEMGVLNSDAITGYSERTLEALEGASEASKNIMKNMLGGDFAKIFEGLDVKIDPNVGKELLTSLDINAVEALLNDTFTNVTKQFGSGLEAARKKRREATVNVEKAKGGNEKEMLAAEEALVVATQQEREISSAIKTLQSARLDILKTTGATVEVISRQYNDQADQARKLNVVYEKRLGLERDVMEAAQFGMGASLQMMQQQVSMASQMMKIEQERLALSDQVVQKELQKEKIDAKSAASMQTQLKAAKNSVQAASMIMKFSRDNVSVQKILTDYSQTQQDANGNILEQQKKIYDLTKEIREGYLDAVREMSVGAGEFEKIIGKQDMGVTQLMDAVNQFTTTGQKNILNTMKLGGNSQVGSDAYEARKGITGGYSAAGGSIINFKTAGDENADIYGFGAAQKKYDAMQRGTGTSEGVGSAMVATDQYIGPQKEANMEESTQKGTQEGAERGTYAGLNKFFGVNPGVFSGSFGQDENLNNNGTRLGLTLAKSIPQSEIGDPRALAAAFPMPDIQRVDALDEYIDKTSVACKKLEKEIPTLTASFKKATEEEKRRLKKSLDQKQQELQENKQNISVARQYKEELIQGGTSGTNFGYTSKQEVQDGRYYRNVKVSEGGISGTVPEKTKGDLAVENKSKIDEEKQKKYVELESESERIKKVISTINAPESNAQPESKSQGVISSARVWLAKNILGVPKAIEGYRLRRRTGSENLYSDLFGREVTGEFSKKNIGRLKPDQILRNKKLLELAKRQGQIKAEQEALLAKAEQAEALAVSPSKDKNTPPSQQTQEAAKQAQLEIQAQQLRSTIQNKIPKGATPEYIAKIALQELVSGGNTPTSETHKLSIAASKIKPQNPVHGGIVGEDESNNNYKKTAQKIIPNAEVRNGKVQINGGLGSPIAGGGGWTDRIGGGNEITAGSPNQESNGTNGKVEVIISLSGPIEATISDVAAMKDVMVTLTRTDRPA